MLKYRARIILVLLLILYVGPYLALSRRGYAEADRYNMKGFYYLAPANSTRWHVLNTTCYIVFYPLNAVDRLLGTGRVPGWTEPLWGLEK